MDKDLGSERRLALPVHLGEWARCTVKGKLGGVPFSITTDAQGGFEGDEVEGPRTVADVEVGSVKYQFVLLNCVPAEDMLSTVLAGIVKGLLDGRE
ncbi:MAG: hypothetical protein ACYTBJ_00505 [Planctomycetota bacterium]|jgi:hypothetical protein